MCAGYKPDDVGVPHDLHDVCLALDKVDFCGAQTRLLDVLDRDSLARRAVRCHVDIAKVALANLADQ